MNTLAKRVIPIGLLMGAAFAVITHGAVEPWSKAILELWTLFLTCLWVMDCLFARRFRIYVPLTAVPLLLFVLLGGIQQIRWATSGGDRWTFSVDPEATASAVMLMACILVMHVLGATYLYNRLSTVLMFVLVLGYAAALLGLLELVAGNGSIYWMRPAQSGGPGAWATGPFVNHNHFAGLLELLIPLPLAAVLTRYDKRLLIIQAFGVSLMIVVLILTASRGGIISGFVGIGATLGLGTRFRERTGKQAPGGGRLRVWILAACFFAVLTAAAAIGSLWIGLGPLVERLVPNPESTSVEVDSAESRQDIWQVGWTIFKAHPVVGSGLGTFGTAYPVYSSTNETSIIDRTHNDYLQVLSDSGVVGALLAICFGFALARRWPTALRVNDPWNATFAIGCSGAIVSILCHSVVDFNLQIPSNAIIFLFWCGILDRVAHSLVLDQDVEQDQKSPSPATLLIPAI